MRRNVIIAAVVAALVPAGAAVATTTPPDTEPPDTTETTAPSETAPEETGEVTETTAAEGTAPEPTETTEAPTVEPATIYDEDGNPVATVTVTETELSWTDYQEGDAPEEGREYLRVTVFVESLVTEDEFGINVDHFILQDNYGFVTTARSVPTAAQAEADEGITEDADLAGSESVELALTFEHDANAGPQSVFYRRDDDRLTDIAEIG